MKTFKNVTKIFAFALAIILSVTITAHARVEASQSIPTSNKSVASTSSSSAYHLNRSEYTYSPFIYVPASGKKIAITIDSSFEQSIRVRVYNSSGLVRSYSITLESDESITLYTNISAGTYFKFENAGSTSAISYYTVFSY